MKRRRRAPKPRFAFKTAENAARQSLKRFRLFPLPTEKIGYDAFMTVPHLTTVLSGSPSALEQRMTQTAPAVERRFRSEWMDASPPLFAAVDVHYAGYKLAAVRVDLFPAQWRKLSPDVLPQTVLAAQATLEKFCPEAKRLLIIVPDHPSPDDLPNLQQLRRIFTLAGMDVRFGTATSDRAAVYGDISVEPVQRERRRLVLRSFDPCTVLLSADVAGAAHGLLDELPDQTLWPPPHASRRRFRLSVFAKAYEKAAKQLGKVLAVDPWLLHPTSRACPPQSDFAALRETVHDVLLQLRRRQREYGLTQRPGVRLLTDIGGAPLLPAPIYNAAQLSAEEIPADALLDGVQVIEDVPTVESLQDTPVAPQVYMLDRYVVGGFYRPTVATPDDAPFQALTLQNPLPQHAGEEPNRFYMYGVIARLAVLAVSHALEITDPRMICDGSCS